MDASPPPQVDDLWHDLLLHTRLYSQICQKLARMAGKPSDSAFIHHDALLAKTQDGKVGRYSTTLNHYRRLFGEPPVAYWPPVPVQPILPQVRQSDRIRGVKFNGRLFVTTLTGISRKIVLPKGHHSVLDLKKSIHATEGIPVDQQRLVYAGQQLEDGFDLIHYNVCDGCRVFLILRLKGC